MGGGGGDAPQVQKTEDMIAQQQINAKMWNHYIQNYKPLIEKFSAKAQDPEQRIAQERDVAGKINAEVMKNIKPGGVSANPVANARKISDLAGLGTGAQVEGQGGVRSRQIGDVQSIIDIGRGQATTVQAGFGDIASASVRSAIAKEDASQRADAATDEAYGSVAGAVAAGLLKTKTPSRTIDDEIKNRIYT